MLQLHSVILESIIEYLVSNYPDIAIALILLFIIGACGWFVRVIYDKIIYSYKQVKQINGSLNDKITSIETKIGTLENKTDSTNREISDIKTQLNTIITTLSNKFDIDVSLFKINSPRELTDIGLAILSTIKGDKYVDNNLIELIKAIEITKPKTGLDVEMNISSLLYSKTNEDAFSEIKQTIFNNPEYKTQDNKKIPLDLTIAISLMVVYLRNKYFEKYPNLKNDL